MSLSLRIACHENDVAGPATRELRFAEGLLETAGEANEVWTRKITSWQNGRPDPSLPPVGENACRVKGDHAAIWLARSITILLKGV